MPLKNIENTENVKIRLIYLETETHFYTKSHGFTQLFSLPNKAIKRTIRIYIRPRWRSYITSGYIEVSAGIKRNVFNNPTSSEARRRSIFNFDQDINMTMNAKVGNRLISTLTITAMPHST